MNLTELAALLISTAITPRKIIAGVVVLIVVVAIGVWWASRRRASP